MHRASRGALRLLLAVAAVSCVSPALPAFADTLEVTGIKAVEGDGFELSVPSVTIEDGNFTEDQVRALFGGGDRQTFAALAGLTAKSVAIPEISLTYQVPGADGAPNKSTTVYHGFEMTDVVDGVAAGASLASSEVVGEEGVAVKWGSLSTGRFDLSALVGFYGIGPGAGTDEIRAVFDDLHFAGGTIDAKQLHCDIGEAAAGNFSARPLKTSLVDLSRIVGEVQAASKTGDEPSPEAVKALVGFYADVLTAMRSSPLTLAGFDCAEDDPVSGKTTIGTGKVTVGGFEPGIYPPVSADAINVVAKDGSVKLGNFTFKQIDFNEPLKVLAAATALDEDWFVANARKLIPAFDGFSLSGLAIDVPGEEPSARIAASLDSLDLSLGQYVNGIPSDIALTADGFDYPLPTDAKDGPAPDLIKAGITRLDIDFGSHIHWNKDARTIEVSQLMLDAGQLGRVSISGTLGNATDKLFDDSPEAAMAAADALTVKSVTIELADAGMGNILISAGARDAGQPEPLFRTTLAGMAQGMVLAVLGNSDDALGAVKALGDFIAGAPELRVTLTSVDPAGVPLSIFAGAGTDPTVLAGKVTISAESTGAPPVAPATPQMPAAPESPPPAADEPTAPPATETPPSEAPAAAVPPPPAAAASAPAPGGSADTVQQEKLRLKAPPRAN
jgi:hypothetical protein